MKHEASESGADNSGNCLRAREVMALLGYRDRSSFWAAVKTSGIPFIRLSPRRTLFERAALRAFLDSRRVG
jgi:predicted DNA-binding transcriptional regulator AlpA